MAIPFFSVDMSAGEWSAYIMGLLNHGNWFGKPNSDLAEILNDRFQSHEVILLPSARMGFHCLMKQQFRPGDKIIFSGMSFPLYVKIAVELGLVPVFVDVEPEHLNIDPEKIRKAITKETKAIVVTNLFGHPAQLESIKEITDQFGIPIIEDCAQSYDSFFRGQETGTSGWVGIFSCSLMKVPTTLGGGVFLTKDKELAITIRATVEKLYFSRRKRGAASYHAKGLVSVLNSYPALYSLISHQVFGLIKKRNPALLRRILYSGMGMGDNRYDPRERPPLAEYQKRIGANQFGRAREMTEKRRRNSAILDESLRKSNKVMIFKEGVDVFWNYQYHVVDLGAQMDRVFEFMFSRGVHVMKENVWDCTAYGFPEAEYSNCPIARSRNRGLLRIPNNSFLPETRMFKIVDALLAALN